MQIHFMRKTKDCSGETLTETLVAVLIGSIAMSLLAGMISSSGNLITKSMKTMDEYYAGNNVLVSQEDVEGPDYVTVTEGMVTIREVKDGVESDIVKLNVGVNEVNVTYYINNRIPRAAAVSYQKK